MQEDNLTKPRIVKKKNTDMMNSFISLFYLVCLLRDRFTETDCFKAKNVVITDYIVITED